MEIVHIRTRQRRVCLCGAVIVSQGQISRVTVMHGTPVVEHTPLASHRRTTTAKKATCKWCLMLWDYWLLYISKRPPLPSTKEIRGLWPKAKGS